MLVCATVASFQPGPIDPARSVAVSSANISPWPFTVSSGRLLCGGTDYQVWFDGNDGRRYALSASAMSHSFLTPRATSIRKGGVTYSWPAGTALLDRGMQLCPGGRHYRNPPGLPQ